MSRELVAQVKNSLEQMTPQFTAALPPHISVEKFQRVAITAIQQAPALLQADRTSLFQSCIRAAQDGLLPDGREAALVVFGKQVQYMPMVAGVLKKVRNSGELSTIAAHVVYEGDDFTYELGDSERIVHRPTLQKRGKPIAVYAVAHLKDGSVQREVMSVEEVEEVRNVSRAKNAGPWQTWWSEMARKTVLRRLSKYLPQSTDRDGLSEVLERDEPLWSPEEGAGPVIDATEEPAPAKRGRPKKRIEQAIEDTTPAEPVDETPDAEPNDYGVDSDGPEPEDADYEDVM